MDKNISAQQDQKVFKILGIEGGVFIIFVILLMGVLNYLNVFPLSKMYPGFFGFLPHKAIVKTGNNAGAPQSAVTPPPPEVRKTLPFISCPLSPDICKTGQAIAEGVAGGQNIYGVRFSNIPKDSTILASLSGQKISSAGSFTISNTDRGIEVRYLISGDFTSISDAIVTENLVLGSFNGSSNTLTLYATATRAKQSVQLGIEKNGQYLTSQE